MKAAGIILCGGKSTRMGVAKATLQRSLITQTRSQAFALCGLVPLVPFLLGLSHAFTISVILTGAVFFIIGSIKSRWSTVAWWRSGISTLVVGGVAAGLAYAVGVFLKRLAQ